MSISEYLSYAYQYHDREGNLIFRYDNAAHKPKLEMAEHKHSPDGIVVADPPDMAALMEERCRKMTQGVSCESLQKPIIPFLWAKTAI